MSSIRCPFCQQKLDDSNYYICCFNPHCNATSGMFGTEELWQELIRTRKALDWAKNAILVAKQTTAQGDVWETLEEALEQITALEQKDE